MHMYTSMYDSYECMHAETQFAFILVTSWQKCLLYLAHVRHWANPQTQKERGAFSKTYGKEHILYGHPSYTNIRHSLDKYLQVKFYTKGHSHFLPEKIHLN